MAKTATLFMTEGRQAVRLPEEYRFDGEVVLISRDEATGDVILSSKPDAKPDTWDDFFESLRGLDVPEDFGRESKQPTLDRDPLAGISGDDVDA